MHPIYQVFDLLIWCCRISEFGEEDSVEAMEEGGRVHESTALVLLNHARSGIFGTEELTVSA